MLILELFPFALSLFVFCFFTALPSPPSNNVGNEVLASLLNLVKGLPPISLGVTREISSLSKSCIDKGREFLIWVLSPTSGVDEDGKRMALELMFLFALQEGITCTYIHVHLVCTYCTCTL